MSEISRELRWFFKDDIKSIPLWFAKYGLILKNIEPRDDFYYPAPDIKAGIKLREGNIEIKTRIGRRVIKKLTANIIGYEDVWDKLSFTLQPNDPLTKEIINQRKNNWIKCKKIRMGLKLTQAKNGTILFHNIDTELESGSQLEYTRINIKNTTWYTFAAEDFGKNMDALYKPLLPEIISGARLFKKDSYGYPEFIKIFSNGATP